jgi:hypothetical protein
MTTKLTPGPWIVQGPHDAPWVSTADHKTIVPRTVADARLIAAALDMYVELLEARAFIDDTEGPGARRLRAELDAAIDKATKE